MKMANVVAMMVLMVTPLDVFAHGVWIEREGSGYKVVYGEGEKGSSEPYDGNRLKHVAAYDRLGKPIENRIERSDTGAIVKTQRPAALLLADFDNGYWIRVRGEWKQGTKRDHPSSESSEESIKYAKGIFGSSSMRKHVFDLPLEIVPLVDPAMLKRGDRIGLVVCTGGTPASDAEIVYNGSADVLKADADGKTNITITKSGLNYIEAMIRKPMKDNSLVDHQFITATLTFDVP